jgi:hypothetical protein
MTFVISQAITRSCTTVWNAVNVLRLAMQVYEERILQPGHTTRLKTSKCVTFLCRYWIIEISFQIISSKPLTRWAFYLMNMKVLNKLISQEEDIPVSWPSSEQSLLSSYHPSPKERSDENVKMEDREQALQHWLNKDDKKRYGLATVRKRIRFVQTSAVLLEMSNKMARSPTPTDQENGIRPTVRRIH